MNEVHLEEILKIENDLYHSPWTLKMFKEDLENKYAFNYVLIENKEVIGYYGVWIVNDYATVTKVTVRKDYQGKHLGDYIFNDLIALCVRKGCSCLDLEVREDNLKALSLYKKNGFEITRIVKDYYGAGINALNMVKILKKEGKRYGKIHISN